MADATPSVREMESEARDLLDRMSTSDPRKGMVNRLLLKLSTRIGGTASAATLAAMAAATGKIQGLPGAGKFAAVLAEADAVVESIAPPV